LSFSKCFLSVYESIWFLGPEFRKISPELTFFL
jgi:hypothetical protein